jgi:hypothetical protein
MEHMKNIRTRREIRKESFHEVQPYVSFSLKFLCFRASHGNPKEFHMVQIQRGV